MPTFGVASCPRRLIQRRAALLVQTLADVFEIFIALGVVAEVGDLAVGGDGEWMTGRGGFGRWRILLIDG